MVNQKSQMVKISAAFLEHSIDNLCYATYMYKVELIGGEVGRANSFDTRCSNSAIRTHNP